MTFVKVISGILGFVVAIVAIPLLVISAGMFSLTDGDEVTLPTISATTSSRAMTFGEIDLDWDGSIVIDDVEEISVAVDGDGLFVGVARTNDVDRFLATDLPPQRVDIWLDDASGSDPVIDIDTEGLWTAVVMNADGSRGVDADVSVTIPSAPIRVASSLIMGAGAMAAIAATLLFVVAFRRPRPQAQPVVERQPEPV
jgi:hypothetical protein